MTDICEITEYCGKFRMGKYVVRFSKESSILCQVDVLPSSTPALAGLSSSLMCISPPTHPTEKVVIQKQVVGCQQNILAQLCPSLFFQLRCHYDCNFILFCWVQLVVA